MAFNDSKRKTQAAFVFRARGGKRKGAGRPAKGWRGSEPQGLRERFDRLSAVHITLRVVDDFPTLRSRSSYFAIRKATQAVLRRSDFRIVHVSLEKDHLHLIVEADNNEALTRGVQAFQISAAQHLN